MAWHHRPPSDLLSTDGPSHSLRTGTRDASVSIDWPVCRTSASVHGLADALPTEQPDTFRNAPVRCQLSLFAAASYSTYLACTRRELRQETAGPAVADLVGGKL